MFFYLLVYKIKLDNFTLSIAFNYYLFIYLLILWLDIEKVFEYIRPDGVSLDGMTPMTFKALL